MHRDPVQVTAVLDEEERLDRPLQDTRERHIKCQFMVVNHLQQQSALHDHYTVLQWTDYLAGHQLTSGNDIQPVVG